MKTLILILVIINFYLDIKILLNIYKFYKDYEKVLESYNDDIDKHILLLQVRRITNE